MIFVWFNSFKIKFDYMIVDCFTIERGLGFKKEKFQFNTQL